MFYMKKAGLLCLLFIAGCSPHPVAGTWLSSAPNQAGFEKVVVHFDAELEVYSATSNEPVLKCRWWATGKQSVELECMSMAGTEVIEKYQFNVVDDTAELIKQGKLLARFKRQKE